MLKKTMIILLALWSVFVLGTSVMAAETDSTVYIDYSQHDTVSDTTVDFMAIGGDFRDGHWMAGGQYYASVKISPDTPDSSLNYYQVYGGYNFLNSDSAAFGLIAAYGTWTSDASTDTSIRSVMLGLRGAWRQNGLNFSFSYLSGIDNVLEINGAKAAEPQIGYWEVKGGYEFSNGLGVYLTYRDYSIDDDSLSGGTHGLGAGIQYRF